MSDSAGGKTAVESKKGNKRRGDFGRDFFLPQVLRKGHMIFEQEFEGENHVCI
jgi:ATP-dependent RNA circularization protein (DNA/RNA ligase family)